MNDLADSIKARFRLLCRKCGSNDVVIDYEPGIDYGGETGYCEGFIAIGCNSCKDNDLHETV